MLVIGARLKSTQIEWLLSPRKTAEGCAITRWLLLGNNFGLVMRTTHDLLMISPRIILTVKYFWTVSRLTKIPALCSAVF